MCCRRDALEEHGGQVEPFKLNAAKQSFYIWVVKSFDLTREQSMKFESAIGIGEICEYNDNPVMSTRRMETALVKVVAVTFDVGGKASYTVEHVGRSFGVQRFGCGAAQLCGDPEFDQELGAYPSEEST